MKTVFTIPRAGYGIAVAACLAIALMDPGCKSSRARPGGVEDVAVTNCDGSSVAMVPANATGKSLADALLDQWKREHPDRDWVAEEKEKHELKPPADNSALLKGDQGEGHTYGQVTERDLVVWSREAEKFAADGTHLQTVGRRGQARGEFTSARSVAVDGDGRIYVGSGDDFLVQRFAADGTYLDAFGLAHAGENAWRVGGIALDAAGNIYLSQALAGRIQCFAAADRQLVWELGTVGVGDDAFRSPMGLAVDGDRLYVADQQNHRVQVYDLAR